MSALLALRVIERFLLSCDITESFTTWIGCVLCCHQQDIDSQDVALFRPSPLVLPCCGIERSSIDSSFLETQSTRVLCEIVYNIELWQADGVVGITFDSEHSDCGRSADDPQSSHVNNAIDDVALSSVKTSAIVRILKVASCLARPRNIHPDRVSENGFSFLRSLYQRAFDHRCSSASGNIVFKFLASRLDTRNYEIRPSRFISQGSYHSVNVFLYVRGTTLLIPCWFENQR